MLCNPAEKQSFYSNYLKENLSEICVLTFKDLVRT